jgi:hypothetical protein
MLIMIDKLMFFKRETITTTTLNLKLICDGYFSFFFKFKPKLLLIQTKIKIKCT